MSIADSQSLLKFMSIESVMPSNHLILCRSLHLLPSIFPSIRVFFNESALHIRWPEYWSFSFSISPSNEYLGLISCRVDWLDLLAVQGTLESLLQNVCLYYHIFVFQFFIDALTECIKNTERKVGCVYLERIHSMPLTSVYHIYKISESAGQSIFQI